MFRNHPKTNAFDINRIEQHVAAIKFLSDALLRSNERDLLSSHLAVMMNAINSFEKHRFSDYQFNKTKRAEQVLHTRNIFNALYKGQLKQTNVSILAHALKHELKDYVTSVDDFVAEVQHDLVESNNDALERAENEMEWAMLETEIRQAEIEYQARCLAEAAEDAEEDDIDYLINNISMDEITEEELMNKPYLRRSMPSFSDSDESVSDDNDSDYSPRFR